MVILLGHPIIQRAVRTGPLTVLAPSICRPCAGVIVLFCRFQAFVNSEDAGEFDSSPAITFTALGLQGTGVETMTFTTVGLPESDWISLAEVGNVHSGIVARPTTICRTCRIRKALRVYSTCSRMLMLPSRAVRSDSI